MKNQYGKIEMFPIGVSMLEYFNGPFTEKTDEDGVLRRYLQLDAVTAECVTWKHEGSSGPCYVNGHPLAEEKYPEENFWSECFYSRANARKLARNLGVPFEEV